MPPRAAAGEHAAAPSRTGRPLGAALSITKRAACSCHCEIAYEHASEQKRPRGESSNRSAICITAEQRALQLRRAGGVNGNFQRIVEHKAKET